VDPPHPPRVSAAPILGFLLSVKRPKVHVTKVRRLLIVHENPSDSISAPLFQQASELMRIESISHLAPMLSSRAWLRPAFHWIVPLARWLPLAEWQRQPGSGANQLKYLSVFWLATAYWLNCLCPERVMP